MIAVESINKATLQEFFGIGILLFSKDANSLISNFLTKLNGTSSGGSLDKAWLDLQQATDQCFNELLKIAKHDLNIKPFYDSGCNNVIKRVLLQYIP